MICNWLASLHGHIPKIFNRKSRWHCLTISFPLLPYFWHKPKVIALQILNFRWKEGEGWKMPEVCDANTLYELKVSYKKDWLRHIKCNAKSGSELFPPLYLRLLLKKYFYSVKTYRCPFSSSIIALYPSKNVFLCMYTSPMFPNGKDGFNDGTPGTVFHLR